MPTYADRVDVLGAPTLIDSFLVYIDALGTGAALNGPLDAVEVRFQSFRKAWAEARRIAGLEDSSSVATSIFSDLVVAALPILDDGEAEWGSLVSTAGLFQFFLSIEGVFVRGSLVRGHAWVDDAIVYGPALADAYRVERTDAVYPRIVVASAVQEQLRTYIPYYGDNVRNTPMNNEVLVDGAGVVFLDYLQTVFVSENSEQQVDALSRHRQAVISGLLDTRFDPRAQDKMFWSARYHNYFVSTHLPGREDLLIEARDPRIDFVRLEVAWAPNEASD